MCTPCSVLAVGDGFAVFASNAGADTDPDWFHHLVANPEASIEVGTQSLEVTARVLAPRGRRDRSPR